MKRLLLLLCMIPLCRAAEPVSINALKTKLIVASGLFVGMLGIFDLAMLGALSSQGPGYKGFAEGVDIEHIKFSYQKIDPRFLKKYLLYGTAKWLVGALIASSTVFYLLRE